MRSMKRFRAVFAGAVLTAAAIAITVAMPGSAAPPTASSIDSPIKINVMGEWAHPDDDTSIVGPCGVWHQQYGVRCGIIMITRGEGGGNAVGQEIGPALGLRRENEDRTAHYRSGTVDIFNLDKVDFFFNQSAPETQFFWGHDDTLGRVTRVIRMTKPDVYIGFTPTLGAGHGNHQWAGRMIWEGMTAAADPSMFPDQLTGAHALQTWQVKKIFSGGSTAGTGGTTTAADCTTGFIPTPGTNLDTVVGAWTGYASPYLWPAGNVQGQPAGTPKIWAQVATEGSSAYPTQSRTMSKATAAPGCSRFGQTWADVPFQPNTNPDGTANPLAGKDNAVLYGSAIQDPGGLPLGTLEYLTFDRFYNVAGQSFTATLNLKALGGAIPAGTVALTVPTGWTVDGAEGRRRRSPPALRRPWRSPSRRRLVGRDEQLQGLGALHGRRGDGLHGQRRPRRPGRRRPLPSLGQVRRVRPVARDARAERPPAAPVRRDAVDGHGRDGDAAGRRPQLVDGFAEWIGDAHASGRVHRRCDVEAVRAARSRGGHDGQLHPDEHRHDAAGCGDQRSGDDDAGEDDRHRDLVLDACLVGQREPDDDRHTGDDDPVVGIRAGHGRPAGRVGLHGPGTRPQSQVVGRRVRAGRRRLRHVGQRR